MKNLPGEKSQGAIGVETALEVVLHIKKGDEVVVVTDKAKEDIGDVFIEGAKSLGANITVYRLPDELRPLNEIPTELVNSFKGKDVFINAFSGYTEETPFRVKLIHMQMEVGARVGHAPGITMDMVTHGPMQADYLTMAKDAFDLLERVDDASDVHVTAPGGTDFTLCIKDRDFETDVEVAPGSIGNLPAGEIWCGPVEDSMNGVLVIDGCIGDIGPVKEPLTIMVEDGRVVSMETQEKGLIPKLEKAMSVDDWAKIVGELGIGLNPYARLTGNLLEDEKAGGTAHIAFGWNVDMPGGQNKSQTHRDFLFHKPTITITYKDGTVRTVMNDGVIAKR